MSNVSSSSSKIHSKKVNSSRERDKNKSLASESGGSSQCDTPPLIEKDGAQGKFAGIGADSILCMAEQIGVELNSEAATNLAEDISYKLRQTISTIALHSELMKKSSIDSWDVNTVLTLSDTSPVVGACSSRYVPIGEEKLCCELETLVNISELSLTSQTYVYTTLPTVSVEWITDDRSLGSNSNISPYLHNYYTKVARAILNLRKKPKQLAVADLTTNTHIGPIFPNLFNLAVLVLNEDNLNALNVPAKKPLQSNVLDMVDALCSNPCSLDTNIQQQFQRLFPVMVSNILGNGQLADKMVTILTKITRTWPSFIAIGKGILFDYLSQGTKERLTAPMLRCVGALGRRALLQCLGDHLDHIDERIHAPRRREPRADLRETILDISTCLLRSEPTTYLEDYVTTDSTLYEMLGDSIAPRRTIFPTSEHQVPSRRESENIDEDLPFLPLRPIIKLPKIRVIPKNRRSRPVPRETIFETTNLRTRCIYFNVKSFRNRDVRSQVRTQCSAVSQVDGVSVACGLLHRFRYRLNKPAPFPIYGALTL
ncbi:uncharacterized protein LOC121739832 [Aricia agestis]|uniref:uncharacterized protein LOC121739832 n=1 Tax=Aricia agestis TaxID=91739 RepID=UPI001C206A78|nr:uncharacterized protein LOC121739832 [Aricia agestis]